MSKRPAVEETEARTLMHGRRNLWLGLVCLLAILVYTPTIGHQFVYDDRVLIEQNPLLKDIRGLPRLFFTDLWSGVGAPSSKEAAADSDPATQRRRYRPMLMASYALNYAMGGLNPVGYHLVNVLFHAVASGLLYLVALELGWTPLGAFAASSLFALHPLHVEAVAWVAGRPEMMMAMGFLGALWCHLRGRRGAALALFLFALFSKEQAIVFPALALIADMIARRRAGALTAPGLFRPLWTYVLVLFLFLGLRTAVMGGYQPAPYPFSDNPLEHLEGVAWLFSTAKMAGYYLWLSIWPASLSIDYSYNALPFASSLIDLGVVWALMAWGGLMTVGIWGWRRDPRIAFATTLTVFTFLPAANLILPVGTPFAERLFYLPLGGLCLLMGIASEHIARRTAGVAWQGAMIVGLALLLGVSARTLTRLHDWTTSETLFRSAVAVVPTSARAHFLLGSELLGQGRPETLAESLKELEAALAIYPDYVRSDPALANNLGIALVQLGRYEQARSVLEEAIALRPRWSNPYHHLGFAYMKLGHTDKAIDTWRTGLMLAPDDMLVRLRLSRLLIQERRFEEGLVEADAALARDSEYASGFINRGSALEGLGRRAEARAAYEHVLAMSSAPDIAKTEARTKVAELSHGAR